MQSRSTEGKSSLVTIQTAPISEANASLMGQLRNRPGGLIQSERPAPTPPRSLRPQLPDRIGKLVVQQFPQREAISSLVTDGKKLLTDAFDVTKRIITNKRSNFFPGFARAILRQVDAIKPPETNSTPDSGLIPLLHTLDTIVPLPGYVIERAMNFARATNQNLTSTLPDGRIEQYVFTKDQESRFHLVKFVYNKDVTQEQLARLLRSDGFMHELARYKKEFGLGYLDYIRLSTVEIGKVSKKSEIDISETTETVTNTLLFDLRLHWNDPITRGLVDGLRREKFKRHNPSSLTFASVIKKEESLVIQSIQRQPGELQGYTAHTARGKHKRNY